MTGGTVAEGVCGLTVESIANNGFIEGTGIRIVVYMRSIQVIEPQK